ncbi:DUF4142 domain-containing protein [Sphingomonas crocodyli]|uniref:DUF4142 domain-containing protein n=2 Tax=Sphingomonas crocodyli TaxID=1979270 RepID=A0A437LYQ1_9SPHN|nr:DUF4142 domain-containing protein [Sphingomonas crocodyli]
MPPVDYVKTAGASDLYEIQSSKLVLATSQDPKVRSFAEMMIDHHSRSTADLKAAAAKAKVKIAPPMLTSLQNELIAQLQAERGPARDARYIAEQKAAHGQALNVHEAYAAEGTSPPLKAAAAKIVPVVEHHIHQLMAM